MPKNTRSGTSYDGYTDVSPEDVSQPEWAEPVADKPEPEVKAEPKKAKASTVAKAGNAAGKGSTRS